MEGIIIDLKAAYGIEKAELCKDLNPGKSAMAFGETPSLPINREKSNRV